MIRLLLMPITLPLRILTHGATGSRHRRPRTPRYSHGQCPTTHRSPRAAQRCSTTAAYRRVKAAAIAAERERQREAEYRAIARGVAAAERNAAKEAKRQQRAAAREERERGSAAS